MLANMMREAKASAKIFNQDSTIYQTWELLALNDVAPKDMEQSVQSSTVIALR